MASYSEIVNSRLSCRTLKTWALASTALVNFSLLGNCNALTNKDPLQPRGGTSNTPPYFSSSSTPPFVPRYSAEPPYYHPHSRLNTLHSIRSSSTSSISPQNKEDMACARTFQVVQVPCLSDNYGYIIHDENTGHTAAIDTPCAKSYQKELDLRGWKLTHILNTHHHWDHTGGNEELKTEGVTIIGPIKEKDKIPGIDVAVGGGDSVPFGQTEAAVIDVGGHTKGHIAYHFSSDRVLFSGDALFAMGCGRMFEGTAPQFWDGLERLRDLPDDTMVYCAHEYTESNGRFALSVEPGNEALVRRMEMVRKLRKDGNPTVPSNLGEEKKINPFLRVDVSDEIKKNVGAGKDEPAYSIFAKVRAAKDSFRG